MKKNRNIANVFLIYSKSIGYRIYYRVENIQLPVLHLIFSYYCENIKHKTHKAIIHKTLEL